jgi:hypothetical protein
MYFSYISISDYSSVNSFYKPNIWKDSIVGPCPLSPWVEREELDCTDKLIHANIAIHYNSDEWHTQMLLSKVKEIILKFFEFETERSTLELRSRFVLNSVSKIDNSHMPAYFNQLFFVVFLLLDFTECISSVLCPFCLLSALCTNSIFSIEQCFNSKCSQNTYPLIIYEYSQVR